MLKKLRKKLAARYAGWKRQNRKAEKTGKRGHRKAAKKHRKAIKKLKDLLEKVLDRIEARRPPSGTGAWGGSKSIVQNEVMPVARQWGIGTTSAKRWETFGNPGSDHFMGNTTAYAKDFATDSNYPFGRAIGTALGVPYSGASDDYRNYYITRSGKQFRVQIICGTHGTGPHTHIGIKRA